MPKGIDGRLLRRRAPPLLACLLIALVTVALAAGCGNSGRSDSGSGSGGSTSASTSAPAAASDPSTTEAGGVRTVVPVRPIKQDRFAFARARFVEMCAGCHTLADAGATGRRFNLDAGGGITETHVRSTISEGEPGMPAWREVLSPREYEELVAYLVAVAGRRGGEDDFWHDQLKLRGEGAVWSRADTERLERFAHRIVMERMRPQ